MSETCDHLDDVLDPPAATDVCDECVAAGATWPALRVCRTCGHVGCCDSGAGHARSHYGATGHALIRPFNPSVRGDWTWCYIDDRYVA